MAYDPYIEARTPGSFFSGTKRRPPPRPRNAHVAYIGHVHDDFRRYGPKANKVAAKAAHAATREVKYNAAMGKWVWA
jgi:hypothetical protein